MSMTTDVDEAVGLLQQLGLKEYEARCFVGLSRLSNGTAKKLSEVTGVPRTRVYDAVRVLEEQGLVEIHHTSPQQFRAVPLDEAAETLRDKYEERVEQLHSALNSIEVIDLDDDGEPPVQQVWSMAGQDAIENRTNDLVDQASDEIVLVIGDESLLTSDSVTSLNQVPEGVDLLVGTLTESLQRRVRADVPRATTFVSGLEWLHGDNATEGETAIGRLLLVDRSTILVSSIMPDDKIEQAIFGEGFGNGLIVIARRLMAQGLSSVLDPSQ